MLYENQNRTFNFMHYFCTTSKDSLKLKSYSTSSSEIFFSSNNFSGFAKRENILKLSKTLLLLSAWNKAVCL